MKGKRWAALAVFAMVVALLPLSAVPAVAAGFTETFDSSSGFTTSSGFFSDGGYDYFGITDGATGDFGGGAQPTGLKPYTGFSGYFMAGMDLDGEGAGLPIVVDWTGIDISGIGTLEFSGDFAEYFDSPGDIDAPDYILVQYQIDGGGYNNLIKFVGADFTSSGMYNGVFREDTNFDGTGDGAALGNAAQTFVKAIAGTGSSLDLRMSVYLDSGDEDFAVDNFSIGEATAPTVDDPVINEFSASTTGADVEYVEIFGTPDTDYSAYTVLEIEGDYYNTNTGTVDEVIPVGTTDASGFYLASLSANSLENGTLTLLLVRNFTGTLGDDLDTSDDGVLDVTPWDEVTDAVAVNDGGSSDLTYGVPVLGKNYDGLSSYAPGGASRIPNGVDTDTTSDWMRNDFDLYGITGYSGSPQVGEAENTPGALNAAITLEEVGIGECGDPSTPIYAIQGSGSASSLDGELVVSEGVVVGDFQEGNEFKGFFMQDPAGDSDAATSDGIFVYYGYWNGEVNVGDHVRVLGTVDEYYGLTELTSVSDLSVCATGETVAPTAVSMPVSDVSDWEAYEGMLVTIPQTLYINEFYNYDRYGEIVLGTERQYQPSNVYDPGSPEAAALAAAIPLARITLDDGQSVQNPDFTRHPNGAEFTLANRFRGGDTLNNVTGVVTYDYGAYKIEPTVGADYTAANPRSGTPSDVGGSLKVASFNVLNFFTHLDNGSNLCGPKLDTSQCRGADTQEEYNRQLTKIVAGIIGTGADVVGLQEIENDIYPAGVDGTRANDPVLTLVEALNAVEGEGTWAWAGEANFYNDYPVRNEIIYRTASVIPIGTPVAYEDIAFDREISGYPIGRPPLAQTFAEKSSGGIFTVVTNHFKSKGSSCSSLGDPEDPFQANCNLTRVAQANALLDFVDQLKAVTGDPDVLVIGDLNSYAKEDPIKVLQDEGFTDLHQLFEGSTAYSYVFDGQLGYLDQALANPSMLSQVTGATTWHINADEPDILDYDMTYKSDAQDALYEPNAFRSSDHDPVIVGLDLTPITVIQLEAVVSFYADTGTITGNKTEKILLDRLERAYRFMQRGQDDAYMSQLQAFIDQIYDFTPQFIDQDTADVLAYLAWLLMNQ